MREDRVKNLKTNDTFLYNSPSLIKHRVERLTQSARKENIKRSKAKTKAILKNVTESEGINLRGSNLEQIFPGNMNDLASNFFDKEKISQDNLERYLFQESFVQARIVIKSGNQSCRYLPVMIRFYIGIRDKLKKGKYEFLRKVFNLPSARSLSQYDSIGGNKPDGILYSVLKHIQNEYKLADEKDDWLKMVSLKFDACHICDKVKYSPHIN